MNNIEQAVTQYVHEYDEEVCDRGPSKDNSDPENVCGHGYIIVEVYR